ncbi:MAG: hypothetical protein R2744_03760 [Bacteroidales bacterium]
MISNYTRVDNFTWNEEAGNENDLLDKLSGYDLVIIGIHQTDQRPYNNFGLKPGMERFLSGIPDHLSTITVYFGNPYALARFGQVEKSDALLLAYQDNRFTQELSAQLIFGALGAHGRLPVTINENYPAGYGLITPGKLRLQYGYPENAGVSSKLLEKKIDSIATAGLQG